MLGHPPASVADLKLNPNFKEEVIMQARAQEHKVIPLTRRIHPTAIVDPHAELGIDVEIGPYSIIGPDVEIGSGTKIGPHVIIEGAVKIGSDNQIFTGAIVGCRPQDLKFKGEKTYLIIGDRNMIREYTTLSPGTEGGGGETRVGNDNLIMTATHLAHDCILGNNIIISHGTAIAGHVVIEDQAVIGGLVGIHQFTKVGRMAMVGAHTKLVKDIPPFTLVEGNPATVHGINIVGLRRNGIPPEVRLQLKRAFKILYRSNLNVTQAIEVMEQELEAGPEVEHLIRFIRSAERGICR
jgi:UDP-N-acetylglucosamine acyltransferase